MLLAACLAGLVPASVAAQTLTIQGTVTNTATGTAVSGVSVTVVTAAGVSVGSVTTNASGFYSAPFLPAGTYFAYTSSGPALLDEFFNDIPCPPEGCTAQVATGSTPIVGTPGSVRTANFGLKPGGSISGTVRSIVAGAPLPGVTVMAFVVNGSTQAFAGFGTTDAAGAYAFGDLATGNYLLLTAGPDDYVDEFFDDVPCPGDCDPRLANGVTLVPVTAGTAAPNKNFTLAIGGRVSGKVTDAGTGAPLANVSVSLVARSEIATVYMGSASTDGAGNYTIVGLPTGASYFAYTFNNLGYVDEVFDNLPCAGSCSNLFSGTEIAVTLGATTAGRNFALAAGGSISGTVLNAGTFTPLASVTVDVYQQIGQFPAQVRSTATNASGIYAVTGLPTGTYYLATRNSQGFIDELFDNVPCQGFCDAETVTQGQAVDVTAGATTTGRDFGLTVGGRITGVVTDAATAGPLANVSVAAVLDQPGALKVLGNVNSNGSGVYSIAGLSPGTYYLLTSNNLGLVNEVFNEPSGGVACFGPCLARFAVDNGTPIVVTTGATASGKNMALAAGGRVTGILTDAVTQARLPGVRMRLFANVGGAPVDAGGFANTDALGQYRMPNLPIGQYFLASAGAFATQHVNEIFDNIPCTADTFCSPSAVIATGPPIGVSAGATTSRNVALQPRQQPPGPPSFLRAKTDNFLTQFLWREPTSGGMPTSYVLEAGLAPGTTLGSLAAATTSLTVAGAPPGRFFVRVRGQNAFGLGPPTPDYELVIGANGASPPGPPESLSAFMSGGALTMNWGVANSGGAVTAYLVEAGTASGLANIGALPVTGRTFGVPSVPNGFYFLRVRGLNSLGAGPASNEVLLRVGGGPSPPDAPGLSLPVVSAGTVTLTWSAPVQGPVTHYVIEAGTASGLANLAAFNTGNTLTTLSFGGAPPGTYFVRVRAANAQGVSIVSNEVTLVVP